MDEVYKEVSSTLKSTDSTNLAETPQTAHVPYALPTEDRYLVLVRSKQQIEELDRISENHVSFHTAMTDVSLRLPASTMSRPVLRRISGFIISTQ